MAFTPLYSLPSEYFEEVKTRTSMHLIAYLRSPSLPLWGTTHSRRGPQAKGYASPQKTAGER